MRIRIREQELVMITPETAKLRDLAALQTQTGLKMQPIQDLAEANETIGIQIVTFLSLRNSGQFITWEAVGDYSMADIEPIQDPIDTATSDEQANEADPTSARTASVPGDEDEAKAEASQSSPARTGSKSQSAPVKSPSPTSST